MLLERFGTLFEFLAGCPQQHARSTALYRFTDAVMREAFREARPLFEAEHEVPMAEFGTVRLPYEKMGAIDSIDLFGLDELLMFAFYRRNLARYKHAVDIGANIGLHSIILAKCGIAVESFEPDPQHHAKLLRNLELNGITNCVAQRSAVSDRSGTMQFVRVLGNTTSSHLAGSKAHPYGELERFDVEVQDIKKIAPRADLLKIDAEGHEAVILCAVPIDAWKQLDAFVEIGSPENAVVIFNYFSNSDVNIFSQKRGWARAECLDDVPASYKEGGVFVSSRESMPW